MPTPRLRKSPRLKEFDYIGPLAAHVVCVTNFRHPFFAELNLTPTAIEALDETARKFNAMVHAFCFMPDHAHFLVGIPDGASLAVFVKRFKQFGRLSR